jgi:hypothetical protein
MKSYAQREVFCIELLDMLDIVTAGIARIPGTFGSELRCHELVRAVWSTFGSAHGYTDIVDGKLGMVEHSWLAGETTLAGPSRPFILDVYMPGCMPQVALIDAWDLHPIGRLYVPGKTRTDINKPLVDKLISGMRATIGAGEWPKD